MQSLQEIKGRIDGVKTIRKITKAMQLVSTSKLQRAKKHLNEIFKNNKSQNLVITFWIFNS